MGRARRNLLHLVRTVWAEEIDYLAGMQTVRAEGQADLVTKFEPSLNCFAQDYPELMLDTLSNGACYNIG